MSSYFRDTTLVTKEAAACAPRAPEDDSQGRANTGGDSVPVAPQEVVQSLDPTDDGAGALQLTGRDALTYYERIVEKNLGRENHLAEALAAIHRRKLYRLTHASFGGYINERWQLSRSRAYQLVRFVQRKKQALSTGEPAPANERQARQLDANGTRLRPEENSGARRLARVTQYLQTTLAKSPPGERRELIASVRTVLDNFEQQLDCQHLAASPDPALAERESAACAATADASRGSVRSAGRSLSTPSGPPHAAGAAGSTAAASQDNGIQAPHQARGGAAQERPGPAANTGSVLGLTMDQARKFSYCGR